MKKILFVLVLFTGLMSANVHAETRYGTYFSGFLGLGTLTVDGTSWGTAIVPAGHLGYHMGSFSLEAGYKIMSFELSGSNAERNVIELLARFFFAHYFNFKAGLGNYSYSGSSSRPAEFKPLLGGGFIFPAGSLNLFADFTYHMQGASNDLMDFGVGFRFYF
ncbi:MAG: hypothetical protein ISR65_08765 [Bacteriovoracaceae bacterium]|nr:hypothetical protein [Bacteriovoracaceae bacterium]